MVNFGQGLPNDLPTKKPLDESVPHAPIRPQVLSESEKVLAISNALRYFPKEWHRELADEFLSELEEYGHIYICLLYTSPSPRDRQKSRMPSSA